MTPEEELELADQAKFILGNAAFKAAFESLEEAILSGMRRAAIVDDKLRDKLQVRYCVLHDFKDQLQTLIEGGKLAARNLELEREPTLKERALRVIGF